MGNKDDNMPDEKKIIIDEDWKSQVQREKEQAAKAPQAGASDTAAERPGRAAEAAMPPASLEMLLTMLATEALMALGQMPHPMTGEFHLDRNQAKYLIDMIEMLSDKTKGNLTAPEEQLIENVLHQMRLVFVETGSQPAPTASSGN
jgi:Domain of unknown function (DUF1844)